MADATQTTRFRFWLWLVRLIGVIVPSRLRADWRHEWEAELRYREQFLAEWDRLDWGRIVFVGCRTRCQLSPGTPGGAGRPGSGFTPPIN
jgi:hypothetical protein